MSELSDALRAQRIELAGDVHDRIIPPLFAARMQLESLAARLDQAGEAAGSGSEASGTAEPSVAEIMRAVELIELAITKSRQLLQGLAPHEPGEKHWDAQLRQAVGEQERELHQDGRVPWERITPDAAVLLTSIAEEAIRNAVRHGGAQRIEIHVAPVASDQGEPVSGDDKQLYELAIEDDGQGFDPAQGSDHHGLHLMRLRAVALEGELTLSSRPGGPTRVTLRWPVRVDR